MADKKYVTRGALLQCSKGTHCRRLNLIHGHGIEISIEGRTDDAGAPMSEAGKRHPFMLDTDVIVATKDMSATVQQNISWFGVCREPKYKGESITLHPDTALGEPKNKEVTGTRCHPVIHGTWESVKESVEVQGPNGTGRLLTTDSYIMCDACGGRISFVQKDGEPSDGTDYWDEQDGTTE